MEFSVRIRDGINVEFCLFGSLHKMPKTMKYNKKTGRYEPYKYTKKRLVGMRQNVGRAQYGIRTKRANTLYKKVRTAMLRASDVKAKYQAYYFGGNATPQRSFLHDSIHSCVLGSTGSDTSYPTALSNGAADSNRIGSDVYSSGFRVRGSFGLPFDRRNTIIKIWLVEYNTNQGSPTDVTNWFRNVTGNNVLDPINTERFPGVKLLRTLRAKARDLYVERGEITDTGSIHQLYYDIWVPFKRKLRYSSTSAANPSSGMKEFLSLVMTCYDTYSAASATDNVIVDHDQMVTFYYKDI